MIKYFKDYIEALNEGLIKTYPSEIVLKNILKVLKLFKLNVGGEIIDGKIKLTILNYYNGSKKFYKRMRDASEENGISINSISKSCKGRTLVGGDYLWRYTDINKNLYEKIEHRYGFDINKKVIDSHGNSYKNSLQASIKTKYRLYTICQNLIGEYNLKKISFKYL